MNGTIVTGKVDSVQLTLTVKSTRLRVLHVHAMQNWFYPKRERRTFYSGSMRRKFCSDMSQCGLCLQPIG